MTLEFKRPWKDGTHSIALEPKALLTWLSAIVPPPRRHVTVYSGVLSSHSHWRSQVVPGPKDGKEEQLPETPVGRALETGPDSGVPSPSREDGRPRGGGRSRYIPWHEHLRRTFGSEVVCPDCGGKLRLIGLVKTETNIQTILAAMHLPTGPPQVVFPPPPQKKSLERCPEPVVGWSGGGEADWAG